VNAGNEAGWPEVGRAWSEVPEFVGDHYSFRGYAKTNAGWWWPPGFIDERWIAPVGDCPFHAEDVALDNKSVELAKSPFHGAQD
jgi:hypothetical protein